MQIKWKMKSGDFLDIVEISRENGVRVIFDKTSDKMFEKYMTKINRYEYDVIVEENTLYNFINYSPKTKYNATIFKFVFEFDNEEEAFYYQLKYGFSSNV